MADTRISDLTALTGADSAVDDDYVVVDTSAAETRRQTRAEMFNNVPNLEVTGGTAMGYASGSGGAVTQTTSRTTGVTLNAPSGQITLVSGAGSTSWQTFTVTNGTIAATDTVIVNQASGTDLYQIHVTDVSAGGFDITFATCRDTANFAFGAPLGLYFTTGKVAEMGIPGLPYVIPSLVSISTSPTRLNLASSNPDAQGLGNRALCSIVLQDHAHSDRLVDPYVEGRSWDPLSRERGSFWTRWLARNKYRQNILLKVYEGYAGQALDQMTVRSYFLESIKGPNSGGRITIQGKDILARIEARKAQTPLASPDVLYADIDNSVTGFEVAGAVEADYPASGTLRIGGEIMTYTGRVTSANGITFSGVVRGTDGTTADGHSVDDGVQECLRYTNIRPDDLLEDLLVRGNIPSSYLSLDLWQAEVDAHLNAYRLNALIVEPTDVDQLVSQVQVEAPCNIWWDERKAMVDFKAIRGIDVEPPLLTDAAHIVEGSVSIAEKPREGASRVWMFYNVIDPTESVEDVGNFRNQFIIADLPSETDRQYGEASIRKIVSRWLTSAALVQTTASKIITRYVEVPSEIRFRLDAKDRAIWVGDTVRISHHLDVDQYGNRNIRQWTIVSAEEVIPGETVEYVAEDTTLYGRIHYVMAPGAADYPGYDNAPFRNFYIGGDDGLLSDGRPAGKIS